MHTHQTVDFVRKKVLAPCFLCKSLTLSLVPGVDREGFADSPVLHLPGPFLVTDSMRDRLLPSTQHTQFGSFSCKKMTVMEAVDALDSLVDESDPDVDFPNSFHAFQTAEGIRKAHPDKGASLPAVWGGVASTLGGRTHPGGAGPGIRTLSPGLLTPPGLPQPPSSQCPSSPDWFHLVGLLHDLGKVLALWGEPQVRAGS